MQSQINGVEPEYLQSYSNGFACRFNRRNAPMTAFQTLLGISTWEALFPLRNLIVL